MLSRRAFLPGQKVTHEIYISVVWNSLESFRGLVESHIFFDQIFVGEPGPFDELFFAPAIESIARAGFSLQARSEFPIVSANFLSSDAYQ